MKTGVTVVTPHIPPRRQQLVRAMASVDVQTFAPVAHVVVTDQAAEGEAATRNRGLFAVDTEWTAFLDDDDYLYPSHLSALMRHQETTGADLVYPWFDVEGGTDPFPEREGVDFDEQAYRARGFMPVTYLVRTEFAQDVGGFPPPHSQDWPYPVGVDRGFLWKMLDRRACIVHLNERTWCWCHWGGNLSGRLWTAPDEALVAGDGGPGWDHA